MLNSILARLTLNYKTILISLCICLAIMVLFAAIPPFNHWTWKLKDLDASLFSSYGSFLSGVLGPLVALLSFVLLFKTLTEQRQQFTKASFQTNFYSLLENHRMILNAICDKVDGISTEDERGADFFADLAQRIYIDYGGKPIPVEGKTVAPVCKTSSVGTPRLVAIYNHYFSIHQSDLGHYFRNLYHFVRFIVESDVDDATKKRHMKILRAQLSNYEMLILAYNCLHKFGSKFRPFVEKYELLQNINFELDLNKEYVRRIIDPLLLVQEYPHLRRPFEEQRHDADENAPTH